MKEEKFIKRTYNANEFLKFLNITENETLVDVFTEGSTSGYIVVKTQLKRGVL